MNSIETRTSPDRELLLESQDDFTDGINGESIEVCYEGKERGDWMGMMVVMITLNKVVVHVF